VHVGLDEETELFELLPKSLQKRKFPLPGAGKDVGASSEAPEGYLF